MSGVDRMGDIERWVICRVYADADAARSGDARNADVIGPSVPLGERIEVVRAEQLKGAVKERDELRAILEAARDMIGNTAHHPDLKARVRAALGGQ